MLHLLKHLIVKVRRVLKTKISLSLFLVVALTACSNNEVSPPKPDAVAVSIYDEIEKKAVDEIKTLSGAGNAAPQNLKIFTDPKIDKALVESQVAAINSVTKLLQNFRPSKITLLYWLNSSPEQINWAQKIYDKVKGDKLRNAKITDGTGSGCSNAGANDFKQGKSHNYFISVCAGMNTTADYRIMHEYYHLYQYSNNVPHSAPSWVTEGSADFIGQVLGLRVKDEALFRNHKREIADVSNGTGLNKIYRMMDEGEFVDLMIKQESAGENARISYYVGSLATEYLIGKFGYASWDKFIISYAKSDIQNSDDLFKRKAFAEKFTETFDIEPSDFYVELYPYFKEMTTKYSRI